MPMNSFRISSLKPYLLGEIAQAVLEARQQDRDIIDLSQVNPQLGAPAQAVEKLVQAALRPNNHRYSSSQGIRKLRQAIADWYAKRFNVELDADREVIATMGCKEGVVHLLLALLQSGDTVVVPSPSYPVHTAQISLIGANVINLPLFTDLREASYQLTEDSDDFFMRFESLVEKTWPRPKLMLMNFPHNPTTTIVNLGFFERLVELAKKYQILLAHDFSYADLCFDTYKAPSLLEVRGAKDCAVEFYSLSKGFGMPGWRVGFCLGNEQLITALKRVKSYLDFGIFQPLQIASIEVLNQAEQILTEVRSVYQSRRDILVNGLKNSSLKVHQSKASLLLWAQLEQEQESLSYAKELLEKADVAVCPGAGFDDQAKDFIRLSLVENEKRLQQAVERIRAI